MSKHVSQRLLFIIAGASGSIGAQFVKALLPNNRVVGISKNTESDVRDESLSWLHFDLTDPLAVDAVVSQMDFHSYDRVVFIHSIGIDKFENIKYPQIEVLATIDPVVYNSNVNTYKYIANALIKKLSQERSGGSRTKLVLSMIGSVADKYGLIFIASFSESKNIVRSYMQYAVQEHPWVSALVINISSAITKSAFKIRPYADTTYWLTPEEVVCRSLPQVLKFMDGYREINIYKKDPAYEADYYTNNDKVFKKWSRFVFGDKSS